MKAKINLMTTHAKPVRNPLGFRVVPCRPWAGHRGKCARRAAFYAAQRVARRVQQMARWSSADFDRELERAWTRARYPSRWTYYVEGWSDPVVSR